MPRSEAITGCLLATAVGDALGLPVEGLSRRRIAKLKPWSRYRLILGRGMVSDDTDHAAVVVRALACSAGDPDLFERSLRRGLGAWFLALPAGVGMATAKSCIRMCLGVPEPGVRSAGNGPAMRSAVIGAAVDDTRLLAELVGRSTRLTHTDPRAFHGALAVALAARRSAQGRDPAIAELLVELRTLAPDLDPQFAAELRAASESAGVATADFALARGHTRGVTGFIVHTVPVALHAAHRHPNDPVAAALACIACGGDTDTTAAVAAGIVGARAGKAGIPAELLRRLWDWPRGVNRLEQWGAAAATAMGSGRPVPITAPWYPLMLARNLGFLAIVLGHAARRALPPY